MNTIYDYTVLDGRGQLVPLEQYRGQVVLIVNTASKCGLTSQYAALEELYKRYRDRGFVIIGFPCDQFAHQEPGTNEEIAQFCALNYGVSFPIMGKVKVNGSDAIELYKYLRQRAGGWLGNSIKWNFTKFLISRDGLSVKRYAPITKPQALESDILWLLQE